MGEAGPFDKLRAEADWALGEAGEVLEHASLAGSLVGLTDPPGNGR